MSVHTSGRGVQTPPPPQAPSLNWQNDRASQSSSDWQATAHSPGGATATPDPAAAQELTWVLPSHPQTGSTMVGQIFGFFAQTPAASSPGQTPSIALQY